MGVVEFITAVEFMVVVVGHEKFSIFRPRIPSEVWFINTPPSLFLREQVPLTVQK